MEAAARQPVWAGGAYRPFVSVIVPTCNRREKLEACVRSLIAQAYPAYEIIISDDASTDDTRDFMVRFIAEHPGAAIRYLRFDEHRGANPARNRGVRESRGELIAFTDDDCIAEPGWLENLVRPFADPRVASVVGMVRSPRPANVFELVLKGTQRVPGPKANRLVGGNMCVRRTPLERFMFDEDRATTARHPDGTVDVSVSGRGDEEGLYLMLKAEGHEQLAATDAVVLHDHRYTGRSFFHQALRGGRSAARLVYKYRLPPRLDLLPFLLTYLTLPAALLWRGLIVLPLFFFLAANAAISYNELARKGKTAGEWLLSYPMILVYYHVRLFGYLMEGLRLRFCRSGGVGVRLTPGKSVRASPPALDVQSDRSRLPREP